MLLATNSGNRVLLDTDIFSLLASSDVRTVHPALLARIASFEENAIFLCGVTAEESVRGAMARIRTDDTAGRFGSRCTILVQAIQALAQYPFLPYDAAADAAFRAFPASVKRAGSADCKIAAVAQVQNAVVVTRNIRHFSTIPGTRFEDWTQPA